MADILTLVQTRLGKAGRWVDGRRMDDTCVDNSIFHSEYLNYLRGNCVAQLRFVSASALKNARRCRREGKSNGIFRALCFMAAK